MGFQRGAGGFEFRALTSLGKKLLSSLAERALMLRYSGHNDYLTLALKFD